MIAIRPRKPPRHDGRLGKPPEELRLYLPREKRLSRIDLLLSLGAIAALVSVFWAGGKFGGMVSGTFDEVQIVEEKPPPPPPPPPKEIKKPPKPPAPPPEPHAPPPPKAAPPPPPQFGIEKEGTSEKGDLAVAVGSTLMKKSDSIIRPPTFQPQQLDQEPEAMEKVLPKYPEWAEDQGVTSRVIVLVTIDAQGRVIQTEIQKSGGQDFNQAALEAARATRYKPYIEKGQALPARFAVVYEFVLQ